MTSDRQLRIECVRGDIAAQPDLDAIVNAANAMLAPGAGVAGAIHRAAGSGLYAECEQLAPIRTGQAVITGAHRLPNWWVVHTLGPVYGRDEPAADLLTSCHRESLRIADEAGAKSIGFPAISTGVFGYPVEKAAPVAVSAVRNTAPSLRTIELVRFVLWDNEAMTAFKAALRA